MITYRPVCESDIETLLGLYRSILNFEMDRKYYDYLFREWETGDYSAYVAEDDGRIVGHNGLVHFPVESDGRSVKMATSSGGMVVPEYSGIFYGILKRMLAESEVDGVIAFPNSNSQGFFLKVFEFNSIPQNYFQIRRGSLQFPNPLPVLPQRMNRSESMVRNRIDAHPRHRYERKVAAGTEVIYKLYGEDQVDIIFSNRFDEGFVAILDSLLQANSCLNIVHWDAAFVQSLGFVPAQNNPFVYRLKPRVLDHGYECQMIDSDVF